MLSDEEHKARMRRRKVVVDRHIAEAQQERGLVIVFTGAGKGKTTAALGMVVRCIGHGLKVAVVQFIKGALDTAEARTLNEWHDYVTFLRVGEGYTWETQDRKRDMAFVQQGWKRAKTFLADDQYAMVILDELNIALHLGYVELAEILTALAKRPRHQHVVFTGRHAMPSLMAVADLVTEMKQVKHPFRQGIKAQRGIEY